MPVINRVAEFHAEMTQWRHQIHAHPETAFEEHRRRNWSPGSWNLLSFLSIAVSPGPA